MAIITLVHTLDGNWCMARWLADRSSAIVTSGASTRCHADMIPARRYECTGSMAMITRISRFLSAAVTCRFGSRLPAIVAAGTIPRPRGSVIEAGTQEGGGIEMATFARCIGDDVAIRFGRCHDALAERMATVAIPRCALEHTAHVAGLASRRGMTAGKRKAGGHVIEVTPSQLCFGHGLHRDHG